MACVYAIAVSPACREIDMRGLLAVAGASARRTARILVIVACSSVFSWLLTPLLVPIVKALGIDPIHFGIIMTANLSIGMFTPPSG